MVIGNGIITGFLKLSLALQSVESTLNQVAEALQKGNAALLSDFFATQVEIYLSPSPRIYSKVQAKYVMQEFFQKNPPISFTLLHKGRSEDLIYAIGSYVSQQGRWDVSFFARFHQGRYVIEQLRFESIGG
ncbi:MAG: DUF4783 domain-containing protein [Bacteroidia bacterium]|nr:DUF4783 domain-containing protein [Bacteroidia bacterium]